MYQSFFDLANNEIEGKDFHIVLMDRASPVTIVAPHGGKIEPGTSEIAGALAEKSFSLYAFEGIKKGLNFQTLHITSNRFDEPHCVRMVGQSEVVMTVHGCKGQELLVRVGGRDEKLKSLITEALRHAHIRVEAGAPGQAGSDANNICNRGLTGKGIQLEISAGLRREMLDLAGRDHAEGKKLFDIFVQAVREVILKYQTGVAITS